MSQAPINQDVTAVEPEKAFGRLVALRRLLRALLVVERVGWLVATVVGVSVLVGLVDYSIRMPGWVRVSLFLGGLVAIGWFWLSRVRQAARFRPGLEELALRVQSAVDGQPLAAGVGLLGNPLAVGVVQRAQRALEGMSLRRVVDWRRATLGGAMSIAAAIGLAGLLATVPVYTLIGARRVLTPWSDASWPKRTGVRDVTGVAVHPLGSALPLRAALVKGDASATRVSVQYRLNGGAAREQGLLSQGRTVMLPLEGSEADGPAQGALMETLLEAGAFGSGAEEGKLQYWFVSADDRTDTVTVRLVPPPAVVGAEMRITPPAYLGESEARTLEAGTGGDGRAVVSGVLAGSRVEMTIRMNKPVVGTGRGDDAQAWARNALGEQGVKLLGTADTVVTAESSVWRIGWTQRESVRLNVRPVDADGLEPVSESVYRVELREDKAPEAVVTLPGQDIEALATAKVTVAGEGRDDVGVAWAALEASVAKPKAGSSGTLEAGEAAEVARVEGSGRTALVNAEIDLSKLGVGPGDEVWVVALAADGYEVEGVRHDVGRSLVRKVRVITPDRLIEQAWNELSGVRRNAVRATEEQEQLAERVRKGVAGQARRQAEIGESVARMSKTAREVAERMGQNGLSDADLSAALERAGMLTAQAREASAKAGEAVARAEEAKSRGDKAAESTARQQAGAGQEQVTRALEDLAEALDRGQDAWSTTRAVQRLIEDQAALRKETKELGEKTVGKGAEELTPAERGEAEEIAEKQGELARRTDEQLRNLRQRAEQMKASDPAGSDALKQAAERAERAGVSQSMQQASEQVRRNQQQQAQQRQEQAQKGLEQALEELKQNAQNKDATLRRLMASLIETLNRLVTVQERELAELAGRRAAGGVLVGLDGPMLRLHTQTLGAAGQARDAGREGRRAAQLITAAAEAQQGVVSALRGSPVDGNAAEEGERLSLQKLVQARDEARKQQDDAAQREADRKRGELKKAYSELLTEQGAVRSEGADLVEKDLDRRLRSRARGLAERQEGIAQRGAGLLDEAAGLKESEVFGLAHERLESLARGAAEGLREERVGAVVASRQRGVERVLRQLIEALDEKGPQEEEFREPEEDGGSQSGAPGQAPPLVPPAAEVKLLRLMQQEALALTREAQESGLKGLATEAAVLQRSLSERGAALMKKLQESQGGGQ